MKTYLIAFLLFSSSAYAQIISTKTIEATDKWFPTPKLFIQFMTSVSPEDVQDIKQFIADSKIDINKPFPKTTVEGRKLYFSGLSTPVIWNQNGSFSFKEVSFRYDRNISFKKNLAVFEKSWGTLKEFGNWSKQSRFEFLFLPKASADEADSGLRSSLMKLSSYSFLGVVSDTWNDRPFGTTDKMKQNAKYNAARITCGDHPEYYQGGTTIRIAKQSNSLIELDVAGQYEPIKFSTVGPPEDGDVLFVKDDSDEPLKYEKFKKMKKKKVSKDSQEYIKYPRDVVSEVSKTETKVTESPSNHESRPVVEYDRLDLKAVIHTLVKTCWRKAEKEFNEGSLEVANYIETHHLRLGTSPERPGIIMPKARNVPTETTH